MRATLTAMLAVTVLWPPATILSVVCLTRKTFASIAHVPNLT
jgi:hypothetical protein